MDHYWHVRMISAEGEYAPHPGWIVKDTDPQHAIAKVMSLGLDNNTIEGEFAKWPELCADVVEFNNQTGVAEL